MSSEAAIEFSKSPAIDIFALGATLYCMVVGHPPWMANNQIDLANQIISMDLVFPEGIILDPHLKVILHGMSSLLICMLLSYLELLSSASSLDAYVLPQ